MCAVRAAIASLRLRLPTHIARCGMQRTVKQSDLVNAKLLIGKRLLERREFDGECRMCVSLLHGNGCSYLISRNTSSQFDGPKLVRLHGYAHLAVVGCL